MLKGNRLLEAAAFRRGGQRDSVPSVSERRPGRAIDIEWFKARLLHCRGKITTVISCWTDPGTVLVLNGNRQLELRWHHRRKAVLYASGHVYLEAVLAEKKGWREFPVTSMSLMVFRREDLAGYLVEPFDFNVQ